MKFWNDFCFFFQEEDKGEKLKHGCSVEVENRPEYLKVHAKIQAKMAANVNKLE